MACLGHSLSAANVCLMGTRRAILFSVKFFDVRENAVSSENSPNSTRETTSLPIVGIAGVCAVFLASRLPVLVKDKD